MRRRWFALGFIVGYFVGPTFDYGRQWRADYRFVLEQLRRET